MPGQYAEPRGTCSDEAALRDEQSTDAASFTSRIAVILRIRGIELLGFSEGEESRRPPVRDYLFAGDVASANPRSERGNYSLISPWRKQKYK